VTASGNTPEGRAEDLHALLAAQRLQSPPVIVAWSQGVQDLATYVQRYGTADIAGIVFVDAAVSQGSVAQPDVAAQQSRMMEIYRVHQREYLAGMMATIISASQPPGFLEGLINTAVMTPPAIGVEMLNADFSVDRWPALARIDKPTLIIASGRSGELHQQRAMAETIPRARIEVIADASHAVFLDQPERFNALVSAFLAQIHEG
jgi:non-heme chloroperoxidase